MDVSERKSVLSTRSRATRPQNPALHWWKIIADREGADLPFRPLYSELVKAGDLPDLDEEDWMYLMESRIVEPIEGWARFRARGWGDNESFIKEWFDEGEALQHSSLELEIDEPDRIERALGWIRSLFMVSRVRTA